MNDSQQLRPTHSAPSGNVPTAGRAKLPLTRKASANKADERRGGSLALPKSPVASAASPSVELNIEQLVLHGFPPQSRHCIARTVQRELTRLIAERVPASLTNETSLGQLDAGDFQLAANTRAETVGVRVAQSIYRGMSQ